MKTVEQYFRVVLFILLYKVVLTFTSVNKTLVCDRCDWNFHVQRIPILHAASRSVEEAPQHVTIQMEALIDLINSTFMWWYFIFSVSQIEICIYNGNCKYNYHWSEIMLKSEA